MTSIETEVEAVFDRIDDAFFGLDDQWRFTYLNDRAEELLNVDSEDVVGEVVWEEFPEAVGSVFQERYEHAMGTQEPVVFEEYYPPLDEWFEVRAYPSETGLSVYFRDVTERVQRESELERYETIVNAVDDGIYVVDDDDTFSMVNDAYAEMAGYSREELLGSHVSKVADTMTVEAASTLERELREGERSEASLEATIERPDGDTVEAEASFALLSDGDRVGVVRDISDHKRHERRLVTLHDVARDLLQAESSDELADILTDALHDVIDVPAAGYYQHDSADELLVPAAVSDRGDVVNVDLSSVTPGGETITGTVYDEGATRLYDDVTESSLYDDPGEGLDVRSAIFSAVGDDGVLVAASPETGAFDDETRQLVEIVATTGAVASDRITHEQMLHRQHERLSALNDIDSLVRDLSESVFGLSTRSDIEQLVCDRLAASDSYEFAWVGTVDEDGEVTVNAEAGVDQYLDDLTIAVDGERGSEGPTAEAHRTQEMQVVRDVETDPRYGPWRSHAREYGYRASAAIPVVDGDEMYATLNVYSRRVDAFGAEEREALKRLGSIVGYAISSVRRERELQHQRNRLDFMNRLLRHNLLNGLNVVEARLDLLTGRVDYEVSYHLDTALDRTRELVDFVETVREMTHVIGHEADQELEPQDIGDVLTTHIERAAKVYPDAEYYLDAAPNVDVLADDLLGEVLDNVLINAVQHNPTDDPRVTVETSVGDDAVVVSIADNGPGIDDERKSKLLDRDSRSFDDPESGFGLFLVTEIMDSYGGDVDIEDNDPEGSVFRLTFRRA